MARADLTTALNDCIDRLAEGQTVEECLRAYPQDAAQLRPMLEAGLLTRRSLVTPMEVQIAQERGRAKFQRALRNTPIRRSYPIRQVMALAAMLLIGFIVVGGGLSAAAQASLPGDSLYGLKLFSESLQRATSGNSAELDKQFNDRRVDEVRQLLGASRAAEVNFTGAVQIIEDSTWLIANLPVEVVATLPGADSIQVGDVVRVTANTTTNQQLVATRVELIVRQVVATATPSITPSPTPTATATPTPTASTTNTTVPTLTLTASTTPTPSPSASATSTATPTLTPTRPPATQTASVCTPQQPPGWIPYQVRAGDSLSGLAVATGTTVAELQVVNCITDPALLMVGQRIFLPRQVSIGPTDEGNTNDNSDGDSNPEVPNGNDNSGNDNGNDNDDDSGGGNSGSGGGGDDDDNGNDD